jgi:hypothetical protein
MPWPTSSCSHRGTRDAAGVARGGHRRASDSGDPIPENVEVVGTAAEYIDGDDVGGWIDAMQRTVKDREYRDQLSARTRLLDVGSDDVTIESYLRLMI